MILNFYRDKLTETAIYYLGVFIIMTTWRLMGESINTCLICGCFRGGGDTRFGMITDTIFMWLVAVPLTYLAAYVFKLPPIWVYFVIRENAGGIRSLYQRKMAYEYYQRFRVIRGTLESLYKRNSTMKTG